MKNFFTFVALCMVGLLYSFTQPSSLDNVVAAMKTGNASQLAKFFDNNIEISLPDKSNSYSKNQGELVLKDFFAVNSVKGFDVIHKGENGGSQFCIGNLITKGGSYRTTIYMKQKGNQQVLQELRFENR
jgi:hypothetical protein